MLKNWYQYILFAVSLILFVPFCSCSKPDFSETKSTSKNFAPATTLADIAGFKPAGSTSNNLATPSATSLVINSFTAYPDQVFSGEVSTLEWSVTGSSSISIDHGIGDVSTSQFASIIPVITTTYTLTATNGITSVTATVMVRLRG
jgi:hypothetical protein